MSKVITFSRNFQKTHPKSGEPTYFVEKIWESIYPQFVGWEGFWPLVNSGHGFDIGLNGKYPAKSHTIRHGNRFKVGDKFSPRVWSGKPYCSKQIIIAPDLEIKKVWRVEINFIQTSPVLFLPDIQMNHMDWDTVKEIAKNDGLSIGDFMSWFTSDKKANPFTGQIICWNENINY